MDNEYFTEGYVLMNEYMKEQRIKTRERNFRRRLDNFYKKHKDKEILSLEEEKEYLQLEKYFYNNIVSPTTTKEKALTSQLNILADVGYESKK